MVFEDQYNEIELNEWHRVAISTGFIQYHHYICLLWAIGIIIHSDMGYFCSSHIYFIAIFAIFDNVDYCNSSS